MDLADARMGDVLTLMRCPSCGSRLGRDHRGLVCTTGHSYALRDEFLDFGCVPSDEVTERTFRSFGYEWSSFDDVRAEDEQFWRRYFADVPLDELRGAIALDAGCGKGRYTRFTASHVRTMVALDGSDAIAVAARQLSDEGNIIFVRSDLRSSPFAPGSFDFISCLGVLHHLEDPQEGLEALVRLLAADGLMLIYLYSRPQARSLRDRGVRVATQLRRRSVQLPHPILRAVSAPLAALLYVGLVLPGWAGERLHSRKLARLPLSTYRGKPVRSLWLDTFDRLSAPIEWRFSEIEVKSLCDKVGLEIDALRHDAGFYVVARRVATPLALSVTRR